MVYRGLAAVSAGGRCGRRQSTALGTLVAVSQTPVRVVIAEDEALIRLDLKEMPEEEDYEVAARRRTARRRWSSPLRAPPRRDLGTRDTTWQILRRSAVGESPFLRATINSAHQRGTL